MLAVDLYSQEPTTPNQWQKALYIWLVKSPLAFASKLRSAKLIRWKQWFNLDGFAHGWRSTAFLTGWAMDREETPSVQTEFSTSLFGGLANHSQVGLIHSVVTPRIPSEKTLCQAGGFTAVKLVNFWHHNSCCKHAKNSSSCCRTMRKPIFVVHRELIRRYIEHLLGSHRLIQP